MLDALAKCKAIALDKTGTLTTGDLKCTALEGINLKATYTVNQALAVAFSLEKNAVHPVSK